MKSTKSLRIFSAVLLITLYAINGIAEDIDIPLSVHIKQPETSTEEKDGKFRTGTPYRVTFVLENRTDEIIIVRGFSIPGQLPDIERWYGALYGSSNYKPLEDTWTYNEMNQSLTDPVFAMGVIPPEGQFEITRWVVFESDTLNPMVYYQRMTPEEARLHMYFKMHRAEFTIEHLFEKIEAEQVRTGNRGSIDWSLVIFPHEEKHPIYQDQIPCRVEIDSSAPEPEKKLAGTGFAVQDSIYCNTLDFRVYYTDEGIFLAFEDRNILLPDIERDVFTLIDSGMRDFILPLEGYDRFEPTKPNIEGPGYFNPGITKIDPGDMASLFEEAGQKNHPITVLVYDSSGLGRRYYILVGEFEEQKRRKIANGI